MEQLEYPDFKIWSERKQWFENELDKKQHPLANYLISDQASALLVELQACFCLGAFISAIIISVSIIDAQLRETESLDNKINTAELLKRFYSGNEIDWLRKLRNRYVHVNITQQSLSIDDQYNSRELMENNAKKSVNMVFQALFQSPGT
ncbi:hypothetical protein [Flavihumibacter fluvii]|uniref:hypothetical protein n=1 Tax=Flavihumibacter fluvii TaxID=2838157 RepID=UPI001BDF21F7|nr:hypothetical protein [Flavihumibacter fluvii]ULQ52165.1 hypothetical protein KJS93_18910 [Flavihumibacter fluvii]